MSDQWDRACMAWHTVAGIDLPLYTTVGTRFTMWKWGKATLNPDGPARRQRHIGSASKTAHRRHHESYLADILGRRWNYIMPQGAGQCVQSYVGQLRSDSLAIAKFRPRHRVRTFSALSRHPTKTLFPYQSVRHILPLETNRLLHPFPTEKQDTQTKKLSFTIINLSMCLVFKTNRNLRSHSFIASTWIEIGKTIHSLCRKLDIRYHIIIITTELNGFLLQNQNGATCWPKKKKI